MKSLSTTGRIALAIASIAIAGSPPASAQPNVSTLVDGNGAVGDALVLDADGNMYATSFTSQVAKVDPAGNVTILTSDMSLTTGITLQDSTGTLFVCNNGSGMVITMPVAGGLLDTLLTGVGAGGLTLNATQDTLYMAQYQYHRVSRMALDGTDTLTPWVTTGLFGPVGIDFGDDGNLYVGNFTNGKIKKITPAGEVSLLVHPPNTSTIGYLTNAQGHIYATSFSGHQIWKISYDGTPELYAGTGTPGHTDGPALLAQFNQPNGIAMSVVGDTLNIWVSEYATKNIRRIIEVNGVTSVITEDGPDAVDFRLGAAYPNPFRNGTSFVLDVDHPSEVRLSVHDSTGRRVRTLETGRSFARGTHVVRWDGSDESARPTAAGVYFLRARAGESIVSRRVIRVP